MSLEVTNPFELYFGQDGRPIGAGSLYIGVAGLDPQLNPIDVFYDREMTVPAMQPLNISGGYVWNCCAPTKVFSAVANYSLKVLGKNGEQVFYCQSVESPDEASQISYLAPFFGAVIRTQADKNTDSISIKDFGAKGDGVTDDTQAWIDALAYCNSLKRNSIVSTLKRGGAKLYVPDGIYNLSSISAPLDIYCDVQCGASTVIVPPSYANAVFAIGERSAGMYTYDLSLELPEIARAMGSSIVAGSVGVRVFNVNASTIRFGTIRYFERLVEFVSVGAGCAYNSFYFKQMSYGKRLLSIVPQVGGWVNDNKFFGGNFSIQNTTGARFPEYYHIYIDGTNSTVADNSFWGVSLEGAGAEHLIYVKHGNNNKFYGHHESGLGSYPRVFTCSGDTLTDTAGELLSVGDMIYTYSTTENMPSGMTIFTPYYVVSVSGDTFKASKDKSGTAITFATAGANLRYMRQMSCLFTGNRCADNQLIDMFVPVSNDLQIIQEASATGNGFQRTNRRVIERGLPSDEPLYKGRNTSSSVNQPVFACYDSDVDINNNPHRWVSALSKRGVMFGDGAGGVSGQISVNRVFGILSYVSRYDATGLAHSVHFGQRLMPSAALTGTITANSGMTFSVAFTGVRTNDAIICNAYDVLPAGVIVAWCRCNATDGVQVHLYNATASSVVINHRFGLTSIRSLA